MPLLLLVASSAILCAMIGMYYHNYDLNRWVEIALFSLAIMFALVFGWILKTDRFYWQLFIPMFFTILSFAVFLTFHRFRINIPLEIFFLGLAGGSFFLFVWLLYKL